MSQPEPSKISFNILGWLRADFQQKFGTPRQGALAKSSRAHLELAPPWRGRGILSGLEGFSHVWLISHLHLSVSKRTRGKVHPPRLDGRKIGVLASRSPHRPNNMGLTLAKILHCQDDELQLAEVDLVDGTPILDVKPYLAAADRPEQYSNGWTDALPPRQRECLFSEQADRDLHSHCQEPDRVRLLIYEMLSLDPRPPAYLNRTDARFAVWVAGLNVIIRFQDERFTVVAIEPV